MSKIGIVYSTQSKIIRRVVIPTFDNSEITNHALSAGESLLITDKPNQINPDTISNLIFQNLGITPPSSRCAVVVKANAVSGNVVSVIHADPDIDTISGHTLMLNDTALPGWTWNAASGLKAPASAI